MCFIKFCNVICIRYISEKYFYLSVRYKTFVSMFLLDKNE